MCWSRARAGRRLEAALARQLRDGGSGSSGRARRPLWLLRNHPELKDAQIIRLIGTTKSTIAQIRDRTHWNAQSLTPIDPVSLGLCSQIDLDFEVGRAAKDRPAALAEAGSTLLTVEEAIAPEPVRSETQPFADMSRPKRQDEEKIDVDSVFAKLKQLKRPADEDDDGGY